jgi:transcriptional regulator with XRE-family HTH domain
MPRIHPVKIELAKRGKTQRGFAGEVNISPGTLSQVLNGRAQPWPALRRRVSEALGVPESDLFPEGS